MTIVNIVMTIANKNLNDTFFIGIGHQPKDKCVPDPYVYGLDEPSPIQDTLIH